MNLTEVQVYAVETRAIIHVLWGFLIIMIAALVWLSLDDYGIRKKFRVLRRREQSLVAEITKHKAQLVHYQELVESVEFLKSEMRRNDAIRRKSEQRLIEQNMELDQLRKALGRPLAPNRTAPLTQVHPRKREGT